MNQKKVYQRETVLEAAGRLSVFAISWIQFIMMQYSCFPGISVREHITMQTHWSSVLNVLFFYTLNMIVHLFAGKWGISVLISSLLITIWSVADYFTVLYHGSPLLFSELRSAGTALNVMGQYSYEVDHAVKRILALGFMLLVIAVVLIYFERYSRHYTKRKTAISLIECAVCIFFMYSAFFSRYGIRPEIMAGWSRNSAVRDYGFALAVLDDAEKTIHNLKRPDGYSDQVVREYDSKGIEGTTEKYPDIILILNETFFCMDDFVETGADVDYMEGFYGIENAIYGHSEAPNTGGGTNNAEYELLTGNSMALLRNFAPFNYYDFSKNQDDLVHHLKSLGYSTVAMHCHKPSNYNRNKVYPLLGFDEVILDQSNFHHHEFTYGKRKVTDSDNYKDLIDHYNELEDGPRFMYLLTLQNHGVYEQNDDELDVVHVTKDFGDLTDDMNEYLSSISYSSKAFRELTDYYNTVDRPVIICMTGDHAPSFIPNIENDSYTEQERNIRSKLMPYVIWTNYSMDPGPLYLENINHYELMAMVLKLAGLPMTAYQKQAMELHEAVPVLTKSGVCMERDGNIIESKDTPYEDVINKYLFMEYNSLKHDAGYREELFRIK